MTRIGLLTAALAAVGAMALGMGEARADITIVTGNNPQPPEENVMFESGAETPGLTQTGDTNQTNSPVIFDTNFTAGPGSLGGNGTGQNIVADGIGHANIVCAPGATACANNGGNLDGELTSLEMKPGTGFGWTDVLGNTDFGTGTLNVYAQDNKGNNFDFTLGKGENKFTITAANGEVITDVQLTELASAVGTESFGWNDFKQPTVSGVCTLNANGTCTPIPIPEPASLALLGAGILGLGFIRRRRA